MDCVMPCVLKGMFAIPLHMGFIWAFSGNPFEPVMESKENNTGVQCLGSERNWPANQSCPDSLN